MPSTFNPWRALHPVTRRIALFAALTLCLSAANLQLLWVLWPHDEGYRPFYKYRPRQLRVKYVGGDSWWPMAEAFGYLHSPHTKLLYEKIFFADQKKFQYPPSSLLVLYPLTVIFPERWQMARERSDYFGPLQHNWYYALDYVSLVSLYATILAVALILCFGLRDAIPRASPPALRLGDWIVLALVAIALSFNFYPLLKAYLQGQLQAWTNALFALALLTWMRQLRIAPGALLGLLCLLKPQSGVFLLWGLLRKEWRFAGSFAAVLLIGLALSVGLFGFDNHVDYLRALSFMSKHGECYYPNQSVNGLLNRLLQNGNNTNWEFKLFAPYHPLVHYSTLISSLALVALALLWRLRRPGNAGAVEFCIVGLTVTIASPIAWEHHYGILAPIYALVLPLLLERPVFGRWTGLCFCASYLLTTHFYRVFNLLADTPLNVAQSYLFFGAALLLVLLYALSGARKLPTSCQSRETSGT